MGLSLAIFADSELVVDQIHFTASDRAKRTPHTIVANGSDSVIAAVDRLSDEANASVRHPDHDAACMATADREDTNRVARIVIVTFVAGRAIRGQNRGKSGPIGVAEGPYAAHIPIGKEAARVVKAIGRGGETLSGIRIETGHRIGRQAENRTRTSISCDFFRQRDSIARAIGNRTHLCYYFGCDAIGGRRARFIIAEKAIDATEVVVVGDCRASSCRRGVGSDGRAH